MGYRPDFLIVHVFLLQVLICFCLISAAPSSRGIFTHSSDECDWAGSGLDRDGRSLQGVQPVYLRCREGRIHWQYPRQALRVVLRMGSSGKDFTGCVLFNENTAKAMVYLEDRGALRSLSTVHNTDQGPKCFASVGGQAALFVEAQPTSDNVLEKEVVDFSYDLRPAGRKPEDDCRPCTEDELLFQFCVADFVVRGTISSMYHNTVQKTTELTVRASDVFRDIEHRVFNVQKMEESDVIYYGTVNRPLQCGTKAGSGEFLFLGQWRLNRARISCAPRWSEWKRIQQKALSAQSADCSLM